MNIEAENLDRFNSKAVGLAVSDYLDIRLYFFEEKKRTLISFFFYYRKIKRNNPTATKKQIRRKTIKKLCEQKNKVLTIYKELKYFFEDCKDTQLFNGTLLENLECGEIITKLDSIPYKSNTGKSLIRLRDIGIIKDRLELRSYRLFKV